MQQPVEGGGGLGGSVNMVGLIVGVAVGLIVGGRVGFAVGEATGDKVGAMVLNGGGGGSGSQSHESSKSGLVTMAAAWRSFKLTMLSLKQFAQYVKPSLAVPWKNAL